MRLLFLSTTAVLTRFALTQDSNNATSTTICSNQEEIDELAHGHVNSTGSESFIWNSTAAREFQATEPWYVSILVNNTNRDVDNGGTIAWPYLSVPNDLRNVTTCVYQFASRNATSTGDGSSDVGCAGVLPEGCTTYLRAALLNHTRGGSGSQMQCSLLLNEDKKRADEACGNIGNQGLRGEFPLRFSYLSSNQKDDLDFQNIANDVCSYSSLSGVDIPDNYVTHNIGISLSTFDAPPGARWANYSDMAYDLHVRQSTPFAVVASFDSGSDDGQPNFEEDVQFVCVTPRNTQPGSRVPDTNAQFDTSDASISCRAVEVWSVAIAGVVGLMLAL